MTRSGKQKIKQVNKIIQLKPEKKTRKLNNQIRLNKNLETNRFHKETKPTRGAKRNIKQVNKIIQLKPETKTRKLNNQIRLRDEQIPQRIKINNEMW